VKRVFKEKQREGRGKGGEKEEKWKGMNGAGRENRAGISWQNRNGRGGKWRKKDVRFQIVAYVVATNNVAKLATKFGVQKAPSFGKYYLSHID